MNPRVNDETDITRFGGLMGFISNILKNFALYICHLFIVLLKHHYPTGTPNHCLPKALLEVPFFIYSVLLQRGRVIK